ncbi:hypothetical protein [Legionella waltersii]|uniref:Dot/Icm T4SS effector n=1 Tax=Legionella waltersii TaxID=66969 RepID=A0A0W1A272_9GAMM|nr:hypothetical protein [Legionella waltersii]KTD75477.1 Dot/Icm T4SS effector [Legionella waltersii]SNU98187.1 Dot/Icm secretion system substrate [Legionella waltersii]
MTDSKGSPPSLDNPTELIQQFISLLSAYNDSQLPPPELATRLQILHSHGQLARTIKIAVTQETSLTANQKHWFSTQCLLLSPDDATLLPYIIKLTSFKWLERRMKGNSPLNFELLKIAINNSDYIKEINTNDENQNRFIEAMVVSQFSHRQVLEIIQLAEDKQVKSLLIIYLLSQEDYLTNLKGPSILDAIKNNNQHIPSRLNTFVHQIQPSTLTTQRIGVLEPEAATSILFSIPHFHLLSEQQISALLGRNPHPNIISYWLRHYYFMPNAHLVLAHLMRIASPLVLSELNSLEQPIRDSLSSKMLQHIQLYQPAHLAKLKYTNDRILVHALRLFMQGHQSKSMVEFITLHAFNLLNSKCPFSKNTIQLIICLSQFEQFKRINSYISLFINYYLRANAESGDISLFYEENALNPQCLIQRIQPIAPEDKNKPQEQNTGVLGFLYSATDTTTDNVLELIPTDIKEHPLVAELVQRKKTITSLDYFIMHFKGETKHLDKLITDYLNYCLQEGATETRRQSLHHIVILITRNELSQPIRDTIYSAFLNFPELFDEQIAYFLILHNAKQTIHQYGQQGGVENYNHVVNLCELALKKLNPDLHKEVCDMVKQAQKEATLEIKFSEETGFFDRLFRRFKRCWYYGWTGFFYPNPPMYVVATDNVDANLVQKNTESRINTTAIHDVMQADIIGILKEIKSDCSVENLDALIKSYRVFALKASTKNEESIRQEIQQLYKSLLVLSESNSEISAWLNTHQGLFELNSLRLIEIKLAQNKSDDAQQLAGEFPDSSMFLNEFKKELNCPMPQQIPVITNPSVKKPAPETLLNQTANLLSETVTSALGKLSRFYTRASSYIETSSIAKELSSCSVRIK